MSPVTFRHLLTGTCALILLPLSVEAQGVERSPRPAPRPPVTAGSPQPERPLAMAADPALPADPAPQNADFQRWIIQFRARARTAGISDAVLDRAFRGVRHNANVIARDRNQSEFTRQIWEYLDSAVSDTRVRDGRAALRRHDALLDRIEARYRVEKEIITAVWGLESAYGANRGNIPVIEALATLAHDSRRSRFFEQQLIAALGIVQSGDAPPGKITGSWAGAMGHTQFIPTSYLEYAQDFDGDGRRDIWSDDPGDALASTAAYLARHGWTMGQPWGVEIRLPQGFDYAQSGERTKKSVAEWTRLGVRDITGYPVPDHGRASVFLPAGRQGAAFMIFDNFHVIGRYNAAHAYVVGVGHLADRIAGGPAIQAPWPRSQKPLSRRQKQELQRRLTRAGFNTGGIDGLIGPNTVAAIRAYQGAAGLPPDGFASMELLRRLR